MRCLQIMLHYETQKMHWFQFPIFLSIHPTPTTPKKKNPKWTNDDLGPHNAYCSRDSPSVLPLWILKCWTLEGGCPFISYTIYFGEIETHPASSAQLGNKGNFVFS
jgi:hypothetical protein